MIFLLLFSIIIRLCIAKSTIATFTDSGCKDSLSSLDGPNGYPNGTCVDFRQSGVIGSFMVVGLDPGCTVTIYGQDLSGDPCPSDNQLEIQKAKCYNSTYVYYSIDMCDPAAAQATTPPGPQPTSYTGAIVGGVVGGVLGFAAILGVVIYSTRKRQLRGTFESKAVQVNEMNAQHQRVEMPARISVYEKEGYTKLPPVELDGQAVEGHIRRDIEEPLGGHRND